MTTVRLHGTTLTILRQSASVPGLAHAPSIDLATGAFACSDSCPARHKAHKHTAELADLRAALAACRAVTGMTNYEAVLCLSRTLKVQTGMGNEWLQFQCGQHPDQITDGGAPWAAADTLAHQAAKLILSDRQAVSAAARKGAGKRAA